MRRFSKILTVLLTLCLLCGVFVSVFASAEEATAPVLNVTGDSPMYNDFDGNKSAYGGERSWSNSTNGSPMDITTVDGHLRLYRNPNLKVYNDKSPAPTYHISQLNYTKDPMTTSTSGNVTTSDYVTVDFDLGVDRWTYSYEKTNDNGTPDDTTDDTKETVWVTADTLEGIPEEYRDTAQLAFLPFSMSLSARYATEVDNVATWDSSYFKEDNWFIDVKMVDGKILVYPNKGTTPIYTLASEVGVYDHFTYVVVPSVSSAGADGDSDTYKIDEYLYINGEYVATRNTSGFEAYCIQRLYFSFAAASKGDDCYSFGIDNVAVNYYDKGYKTPDSYGLDDLVADGATKGSIAKCEGVVFTNDYVIPGKSYVATVGDDSYYSFGAAYYSINSGDVINAHADVLNFTPTRYLTSFTVVCDEGKTFSLSEAALAKYDLIQNGNTYSVIINEAALTDRERLNITKHAKNNRDDLSTATQEQGNYGYFGKNNSDAAYTVATEHVFGADGNGYWHYVNNGNTEKNNNGAELQWVPNTFSYNKPHLEDEADYMTVDFDFGTDRYVYRDSEGTYHTADSLDKIPEAYRDAATLAYGNGKGAFNLQLRAHYPSGTAKGTKELNVGSFRTVQDTNGDWYLSADATYSSDDYKLVGEIGAFDHFTFVIKINRKTSSGPHIDSDQAYVAEGDYENLNDSKWYLLANGNYVSEGVIWSTAYSNLTLQALKTGIDNDFREYDRYAFAFDNLATNWYEKGYKSEGYGLDEFMTSGDYKTKPVYDCSDVVYHTDYIAPNGYVSVDGGKTVVFLENFIGAEIAKLADNGTLTTSRDILNFTPADDLTSFTVELVRGAQFTLSAEAKAALWIITEVDADTLTVKKLSKDDAIAFNFVDHTGKVFSTQYLLPGMTLDVATETEKMVNLYDVATATVKHATGWTINGENAEGYKLTTTVGVNKNVSVMPTLATDATLATFAVYYTDDNGLVKLYNGVDAYPTADAFFDTSITNPTNVVLASAVSALKSAAEGAPSGATLTLLYSGTADVGGNTNIAVAAGKTLSIDLNGRTLLQSYKGTTQWGAQLITVGEGATLNLYSSVDGGKIYQAKYNNFSDGVYAQGVIKVGQVNEATVNVGDIYDAKGNLIINCADDFQILGGTLVEVGGGISWTDDNSQVLAGAEDKIAALKASVGDGKKITVNVNGGSYYHGLRSGYAIFTVKCPDVYINANNAKFYNSDGTYAIYHDYSDGTATGKRQTYYGAQSTAVFKNCQIVCMNDAGSSLTPMIYRAGAIKVSDDEQVNTSLYFENCNIIAAHSTNIAGNGSVVIGKGCQVAGLELSNKIVLAEDVDLAYGNSLSLTVSYPRLFRAIDSTLVPMSKTEAGVYYLNPVFYNVPVRSWFNGQKTWGNYFTTVIADVAAAKTVTWYDPAGEVLYTEKWVDGSTVSEKAVPKSVDLDWYDVVYTWDKNTVSGDTEIRPVATVGGNDIKTKYANVTLTSGMTLNIYLPKVEGIVVTGVKVGDANLEVSEVTINVNGEIACYVFSWDSAAASFDSAVATVSFTVTDANYNFAAAAGSAEVKLDVVRYATLVAESGAYACGSEEANLMLEMMNYKEAVATLLNPGYARNDATKAFYAVYEKHTECKCGVDIQIDAEKEVANTEALKDAGITGATFKIDDLGVISMILESANADLSVVVTYYDGMAVQTVEVEYNSELKAYVAKDIHAAYIDNIMSITVGEVSGQYCLAAYINSEAVPAEAKAVATALYEYAMAAEAYKHVTKAEAAK